MNTEKFENVLNERIDKCFKTLSVKADEYATEDRLHNFKVAAELQNCTPITALAGMMAKHTVSVYDLIQRQERGLVVTTEMWNEKIGDSINYLLLLTALVQEKLEDASCGEELNATSCRSRKKERTTQDIIFRGKRTDNGEWVEGLFCVPCNIVFDEIGYDDVLERSGVPVLRDYQVIPETVGQYTKTCDKNGKKIFEGDIVKVHYRRPDGECCTEIREAEYGSTDHCYYPMCWNESCKQCEHRTEVTEIEILGNVHDNPELLKGGEADA